jgi:hypothetical protein
MRDQLVPWPEAVPAFFAGAIHKPATIRSTHWNTITLLRPSAPMRRVDLAEG